MTNWKPYKAPSRNITAACKMAFLQPYFDYDVFVSYSHGVLNGQFDAPLRDWTLELTRRLETDIRAVDTEFDDLHIWRDEQLDRTIHITDELRTKVKSSGILMIVMSPRYLISPWCTDEREWFRLTVQDRARDQGRVFVVRALPTDESKWPEFLRDDRGHAPVGFPFHDPPRNSMPYLWRNSQEKNEKYVQQLWLLRDAVTKRLRELRANRERQSKPSAPRVAAHTGESKCIYLHARAGQAPVRDKVKRLLSHDGIALLTPPVDPGPGLADWKKESRNRIETAKHCDALALVRANDDDDRFEGDLVQIGIRERERIWSDRGAPLPCAIFDQSGQSLPIDVAPFGIERFDLSNEDWPNRFRDWLDKPRDQLVAAL
jgi:TIR domain